MTRLIVQAAGRLCPLRRRTRWHKEQQEPQDSLLITEHTSGCVEFLDLEFHELIRERIFSKLG
jgi:hypothetical protein